MGLTRESKPLLSFTPNHDMIVECLCAQDGLSICSGFTEEVELPRLNRAGKGKSKLPVTVLSEQQLEQSGIPLRVIRGTLPDDG